MPVLYIFSALTSTLFILIFYFLYTGVVGLIILILILIPYLISTLIVKNRINALSSKIYNSTIYQNQILSQAISTITELRIYKRANSVIRLFFKNDKILRNSTSEGTFLQTLPKYVLESAIILSFTIIFYFKNSLNLDSSKILGILIISVGLLQRLQPHVTALSGNFNLIKSNKFALEAVEKLSK